MRTVGLDVSLRTTRLIREFDDEERKRALERARINK